MMVPRPEQDWTRIVKNTVLASAALLIFVSLLATAQTRSDLPANPASATPTMRGAPITRAVATPSSQVSTRFGSVATSLAQAAAPPATNQVSVRQRLAADRNQAGFTGMIPGPQSFVVQANDKSGYPIAMFLSPGLLTAFTTANPNSLLVAATTHKPPTDADVSDSTATARSSNPFLKVASGDALSSQIVGLEIYNGANQRIGTINDIAYGMTGVEAFIVDVGEVFGKGKHYVAVQPSAISLSYSRAGKKWHGVMDINADQLKGAPEYKYPTAS
jgi:hypothetical protein